MLTEKKIPGGQSYFFEKKIFKSCFLIVLGCAFALLGLYGFFTNFYYSCEMGVCDVSGFQERFCGHLSSWEKVRLLGADKVIIEECGFCDIKEGFVNEGFSCGKQTPFLVKIFPFFGLGALFIAFLINHFLNNKGFKFNKINLEDKL